MASDPTRIQAVLIGIDLYSDTNEDENLDGCVRDVENIYDILHTKLGIPSQSIATLTAHCGRGSNTSFRRTGSPTRANVLNELDKWKNMPKQPGDVFIFHYSGHGDRRRTQHRFLKGFNAKDELLCTLNGEISDVELGNRLDELAKQGVTVIAILDCCHSGGLDRKIENKDPATNELRDNPNNANDTRKAGDCKMRRGKRRCRNKDPATNELRDNPNNANDTREPGDRIKTLGTRNANIGQSYLYKHRGYNLIAACQPREYACEVWRDVDGVEKPHGALTYYLVKSMRSLENSMEPVTYERLQGVLKAEIQSADDVEQQPRYLGDPTRILFSADILEDGARRLRANVIEKTSNSVTLNKGLSSSIAVGDQFQLFSPSQSFMGLVTADHSSAVEVEIMSAEDSKAKAILYGEEATSLLGVGIGWIGQLSKRAQPAIVHIRLPEMDPDARQRLEQDWPSYVDPRMPVDLDFSNPVNRVAFSVDVNQGIFQVRDEDGRHMPHLPRVYADGPSNVQQLMGLLHHLCSYRLVANIPCSKSASAPYYDFEIEPIDHSKKEAGTLGAWRVRFKNRHDGPLYVTILNLSPAYGIQMLFPRKDNGSHEVERGTEIEDRGVGFVIDMVPPELLLGSVPPTLFLNGPLEGRAETGPIDPNFEMKDVLKLFVTTEAEDFNHYALADLEVDPDKLVERLEKKLRGRRAKRREPELQTWTVDEIEITTPNKKPKTKTFAKRSLMRREAMGRNLLIGISITGGAAILLGWTFWPASRPYGWIRLYG
jgi:hypothetical protein